jgi:hypothetical protein
MGRQARLLSFASIKSCSRKAATLSHLSASSSKIFLSCGCAMSASVRQNSACFRYSATRRMGASEEREPKESPGHSTRTGGKSSASAQSAGLTVESVWPQTYALGFGDRAVQGHWRGRLCCLNADLPR